MSNAFRIGFGCAVAVIAVLLFYGFATTRGNHLAPTGHIGRMRIQSIDENTSFIVLDFNAKNDSDRDFVVRSITVSVDRPDGPAEGSQVAARDLESAFHAYPALGEQFNPVLKERDAMPAHQEVDRMVGSRFDLPAEKLQNHKVTLRVEDVTGAELLLSK
jgi:hypothetical protein